MENHGSTKKFHRALPRPFMLSGSWLLAGCFIALFTPPQTGAGRWEALG